ncbi:armadillo-type protein [Favolaschia claudopus]|uniref:Armadillo-type protein n=1 Tax=Favolaschia claudopus TaxID=2862362 RepID=A0AAW0AN13_9AGAR
MICRKFSTAQNSPFSRQHAGTAWTRTPLSVKARVIEILKYSARTAWNNSPRTRSPYPMPTTTPDNNLKGGSDAPKIPEASNDLWSLYLEEANERAKGKADLWNGSLNAFLLFAGLFAGVVSSFVIDSRAGLQPGAARSVVAINFLWYSSLTFTLISALAAVLAQTWIVKFSLAPTKGFSGAKQRWIHDDKAERWNLHGAVAYITVFIQLALFLFLAGLAVQAIADRKSIGWTILSLVGVTALLYIGITLLPWLTPTTPFSTPFSDLNRQSDDIYISDDVSSTWKEALKNTKNSSRDRAIGSMWDVFSGVWSASQSAWSNLLQTPSDDHVRQGICWAILKNSSSNESIHAAVVELTDKETPASGSRRVPRRKRLLEFGLPAELCNRLEDLAHLPAGWNLTDVKRMKDYLHMIMWMVDGRKSEDKTRDQILVAFLPLLNPSGALLNLNALPPVCRALAFAVRVHLLVNRRSETAIQSTDWNALVDSLDTNFADPVFRAAIRGLGKGSHSDSLRQDCASMLAVYIGSARFSTEKQGAIVSVASGLERLDDMKIVGGQSRKQPEPDPPIKSFLKHLEKHWKLSMCARAIQLLGEGNMAGFDVLLSFVQNEKFRGAITEMFQQVIDLLSHPEEQVRSIALRLSDQMGEKTSVKNHISQVVVKDLESPDWRKRVAGLRTVMELIKTAELIPEVVENVVPGIMSCVVFPDEDVQLAVVRTLHELVRQNWFQHINDNMQVIITLVADDDTSVREAVVEFLAEIARKDELKTAVNRNIPSIVTRNFKADTWYIRRNGLIALGKFIESDDDFFLTAINHAFAGIDSWLADPDKDVREAAFDTVSLGLKREAYLPMIMKVAPRIIDMINNEEKNHSDAVRITALRTCSAIFDAVSLKLKRETYLPMITKAAPKLIAIIKNDKEDDDVRITALRSCSTIAQIEQVAEFRDTMKEAVSQIMVAFSRASWQIQVAMLKTLTVVGQNKSFVGIIDKVTLDEILGHLTNEDYDVRAQVLDTLGGFAAKDLFHDKIRADIGTVTPLLEDWSWTAQQAALRTFAVFAEHGIVLASDADTINRIISLLAGSDADVCAGVLRILYIAAKTGVPLSIYSMVKFSLVHENWRVRIAALQALVNLANNERIDIPTQEVLDCLSDPAEELRIAALRTLLRFIDDRKFRDQFHVNVSKTLPEIILSLLKSDTEDIRLSVLHIISDLVNKTDFYPAIDATMTNVTELLKDEETRVTILTTVRTLTNAEKYFQTSMALADALHKIFQSSLVSDPQIDVRMATLEIIPAVSRRTELSQVILSLLPNLVTAALKDDGIGNMEEYDVMFRIKAIQILSDLGTQDIFRKEIDAQMVKKYALGIKDKNWPARVAFLKLMWTLGRAELKMAVDEVVVDIIDVLQDEENSVRRAGVQFLNIPLVKETSLNPEKLVPCLVNLLSDIYLEEGVRAEALQILSDLTKQDKFRVELNKVLPALLEDLNCNDTSKRVAALKIWAALAQDETFCNIIRGAATKLSMCLQDPDNDVRCEALATLGRFSQSEAFRTIVTEAAPSVILAMDGSHYLIRIQAITQLAKLAENDAFAEIINSLIPKLMDSLKDSDDEVRAEVLNTLSQLVQQDTYHTSIQQALQAPEVATVVSLMSDPFKHVRMGALRLLSRILEFNPPPRLEPTTDIHSSILNLLTDNDRDVRIGALETMSTLVRQDGNSALEIPQLIELLKSQDLDLNMCAAALRTLSVCVQKPLVSLEIATHVVAISCSVFTENEDEECRAAAAQVVFRLAGQEAPVNNTIMEFLASTLNHPNWHVCVAGLNVMSDLIKQETLVEVIAKNVAVVLHLLKHSEEDVRVCAIQLAVSMGESRGDPGAKTTLNTAIQLVWSKTLDDLERARMKTTDLSIYITALENLAKLSAYEWLPEDTEFSRILPQALIAAVKAQRRSIQLAGLGALSKLAHNANFRDSLTSVISKLTVFLSNKKTDTQILLEVLNIISKLAEYQQFRTSIKKELPDIICVLDNRDTKVRVAGLSVLLKVAEELEPDKLPDRLQSTMPQLLTLLENQNTRQNAVALISCLAKNKTLRADLLATMLALIRDRSPPTWGHLLLISRLLKDERLEIETSDLRFVLCLISSKQTEVQDFVLKNMTTTLQRYLEEWITASTFPTSLSAIFVIPKN